MEELNILNEETIELLKNNNLLLNLVHRLYSEDITKKIELTDNEINTSRENFLKLNKIKTEEQLKSFLDKSNTSEDDFIASITKAEKISKFTREKFSNKVNAHYIKNKSRFDQIVYSLIRVEDIYLAQELYQRIVSKEASFGQLAKEYSNGAEKYTLGIVGPIALDQSHPNVIEAIKNSNEGEPTLPFPVESWWVLLRVESVIESKLDEAMEKYILNELFQEWINKKAKIIVEELTIKSNQ